MTRQELIDAIKTNPHLHFARSVVDSHPELAIQTIANELGQHLAHDEAAFKEHLANVAGALGFTVTFHDKEVTGQPNTHIDEATTVDGAARDAVKIVPANPVVGSATLKKGAPE